MSDGNFKYQLSAKNGADMLNIRADDPNEFRDAIDAIFGEGASLNVLAPYAVTTALGTPTPTPAVTPTPTAPVNGVGTPIDGDAPTEKQVAFARRLGIDPTGHSKKSLSALIDAKVN